MGDSFAPVNLSPDELAVLRACRKDGKPPREIGDAAVHRKLEALGLMDHRVGPAPDGSGPADFWSTNGNGEWALSIIERRAAQRTGKHGGSDGG